MKFLIFLAILSGEFTWYLPAQSTTTAALNHGQNSSTNNASGTISSELPPAAPPVSSKALTRISSGDILDITVYGAPDLSQKVRVNNAGSVYLPLLDYVHLDGLEIGQAQELLEKKYKDGGFIVNPHVSIAISESASGVTVRGQVSKPGVYPILGSAGLLDILSAAGGVTTDASNTVTVTHHDHPDQLEKITVSQDPNRNQQANIPLYQGDTVMVPKAGIVYVVGEVTAPAGLAMTDEKPITITKAMAIVRGPSNNASLNHSFIIRKLADGQQQNIPVPVGKILKAKAQDVPLLADDILYVPNSTAKAVAKAAAQAAVSIASGLSIVAVSRN